MTTNFAAQLRLMANTMRDEGLEPGQMVEEFYTAGTNIALAAYDKETVCAFLRHLVCEIELHHIDAH